MWEVLAASDLLCYTNGMNEQDELRFLGDCLGATFRDISLLQPLPTPTEFARFSRAVDVSGEQEGDPTLPVVALIVIRPL